jgi:predicted DNA-binding protein YlxM (UPF0122 family)
MEKIIVGIASLPDRVNCLEQTIYSLYDQVDKIIVGLNNYEEIPSFLEMNKIESYILDNSLGDAAKFLKIDQFINDYYFACDDDMIYPENYCQLMVEKIQKYKSIIGLHGVNILKPVTSYYKNRKVYHVFNELNEDIEVDLVATSSCAFKTSDIKVSLSDFPIPNMADIWLADLAKKQNVKSIAIKREKSWLKYCEEMEDKWTIYDEYKTKKDEEQTKIVQNW